MAYTLTMSRLVCPLKLMAWHYMQTKASQNKTRSNGDATRLFIDNPTMLLVYHSFHESTPNFELNQWPKPSYLVEVSFGANQRPSCSSAFVDTFCFFGQVEDVLGLWLDVHVYGNDRELMWKQAFGVSTEQFGPSSQNDGPTPHGPNKRWHQVCKARNQSSCSAICSFSFESCHPLACL